MLREDLKELEKNIEYFDYHNKNLTKEQDHKIQAIKEVLEKLKNTHVWFEVARFEVETAIEDVYEYGSYKQKENLDKLTDEDINRIAWRVYDTEYVWERVYEYARSEVLDEIGADDDE